MLQQNTHRSAAVDVTPSLTDDKVNFNYCYLMNLFRCMQFNRVHPSIRTNLLAVNSNGSKTWHHVTTCARL